VVLQCSDVACLLPSTCQLLNAITWPLNAEIVHHLLMGLGVLFCCLVDGRAAHVQPNRVCVVDGRHSSIQACMCARKLSLWLCQLHIESTVPFVGMSWDRTCMRCSRSADMLIWSFLYRNIKIMIVISSAVVMGWLKVGLVFIF
jgi:hypothetical protein